MYFFLNLLEKCQDVLISTIIKDCIIYNEHTSNINKNTNYYKYKYDNIVQYNNIIYVYIEYNYIYVVKILNIFL